MIQETNTKGLTLNLETDVHEKTPRSKDHFLVPKFLSFKFHFQVPRFHFLNLELRNSGMDLKPAMDAGKAVENDSPEKWPFQSARIFASLHLRAFALVQMRFPNLNHTHYCGA